MEQRIGSMAHSDDRKDAALVDRDNKHAERAKLEEQLRRARNRAQSASPGSPDWDAAMAAVEDLEARLLAANPR